MVRVEVDADDAYEKALARRAKPEKDETPQKKSRKKTITDEETIQKKKIKALEKEVKLLVQSIRLKFRDHTVEERIARDRLKYSKMGSYLRNVGVSGVYGPGGAEKDSGYVPSGLPPKKGKGKGKGSPWDKGIVAGAAAAGTVLLVAALYKATQQSKILGVIQSSIGKALGLLIDLVLLPFLPLITWGIIQLYKSITDFGKQWGEMDPTDPFNILALPMLLANALTQPLADAIYEAFFKGWTEPFLLQMVADYNSFVTDFNNFWGEGGGLSHTISEVSGWIGTGLKDAWQAFSNWLLQQPVIGDILLAAGWKHQGLSIPDVTEAEYKKVYASRTPTPVSTSVSVTGETKMVQEVKVQVWMDGHWIDETIERKFASMNWDQRAANWGTM